MLIVDYRGRGRGARETYTSALRTSSRGITPSFSSGKSVFLSENRWKTSLISFSSSAVILFSLASFDARPRFGAAGAEELAAPPRFFGGCKGVSLGWVLMISGVSLPYVYYWQYLWLYRGIGMDKNEDCAPGVTKVGRAAIGRRSMQPASYLSNVVIHHYVHK